MPNVLLNPLPIPDPKGGALNLTRASGVGAALVAVLTTFNGSWDTIFGAGTPSWAKPIVLMAVVLAWTTIASVDILGRGYVAGQRAVAEGQKAVAAGQQAIAEAGRLRVVAMPGLDAIDQRQKDEKCVVSCVRFDSATPADLDFLIIKADGSTEWVSQTDLRFGQSGRKKSKAKSDD